MSYQIKQLFMFVLLLNILNMISTLESKNKLDESYTEMLGVLNDDEGQIIKESFQRQIILWTCIALAAILYFSVMSLVDMNIPKETRFYTGLGLSNREEVH